VDFTDFIAIGARDPDAGEPVALRWRRDDILLGGKGRRYGSHGANGSQRRSILIGRSIARRPTGAGKGPVRTSIRRPAPVGVYRLLQLSATSSPSSTIAPPFDGKEKEGRQKRSNFWFIVWFLLVAQSPSCSVVNNWLRYASVAWAEPPRSRSTRGFVGRVSTIVACGPDATIFGESARVPPGTITKSMR